MNLIHQNRKIDLSIFHHLDINLYPLFIAIYEQKSISKAAQMLYVSQSAASHALQRLRQQLQDDLFVRAGAKMLPTPFAEQIYHPICQALFSIQNISQQRLQFDSSMVKTLKIAVHDEIEPIIFPRLIQHFNQLNLDIQFQSFRLDRKTAVADLAAQQIDFVVDLQQNYGDKIQFQTLVQDYYVLCTHQNHITADDFFSAPHIGVSSRREGILLEDIHLNKKKQNRQIFLRCQHYSTALQILEQYPTAMLSIPKGILSHFQIPKKLNVLDYPVDLPILNIGMFCYKDLLENSRHLFLRGEMIKIFA